MTWSSSDEWRRLGYERTRLWGVWVGLSNLWMPFVEVEHGLLLSKLGVAFGGKMENFQQRSLGARADLAYAVGYCSQFDAWAWTLGEQLASREQLAY